MFFYHAVLCFRDESARDVNGVAGFRRGECNGYIILKGVYIYFF